MIIDNADVFVHLIKIPGKANEVVAPNEDGTYTIFIDVQLSEAARLKAYEHAMQHIWNNDFEKANVQAIEAAAHKAIEQGNKPILASKYEKRIQKLRRERRKIEKQLEEMQRFREQFMPMYGMYGVDGETADLPDRYPEMR